MTSPVCRLLTARMTANSSTNPSPQEKVAQTSRLVDEASDAVIINEDSDAQAHDEAKSDSGTDSGDEAEDTKPEDQTMKPQIKHLDKKFDDDGNKIYLERKSREDKDAKRDWWDLFALCEIRHFWEDGDFKCTQLHVNSPLLKQLLEDVVGDFPNEPMDATAEVEIDLPAYCLFFHRKELEEEGTKRFKDDEEGQAHLRVLLEYIDDTLEDEFRSYRRAITSEAKAINYEHLWTIFKPGTTVYLKFLVQPRAFKLLSFFYCNGDDAGLGLSVEFVDYNGEMFGTRTTEFRIPKYSGTLRCDQLNVKPLDMLAEKDKIREYLIERGHRFEKLVGQNFLQYSGVAVKRKDCGYERFNLTGRVMIDCKTYHRLDPNDAFTVTEIARSEAAKRQRGIRKHNNGSGLDDFAEGKVDDELLDEDRLLTNATVRGFAFTHKRFLEFFVDNLTQIEWNAECFDQLVLDAAPKRTVQALVSMHARRSKNEEAAFDDIVKGKGQGLVMVLHGPPGTLSLRIKDVLH
jgi:hypothetical protein